MNTPKIIYIAIACAIVITAVIIAIAMIRILNRRNARQQMYGDESIPIEQRRLDYGPAAPDKFEDYDEDGPDYAEGLFGRINPSRISFTDETRPDPTIANEWEMYIDPSSKRPFYSNKNTRMSTWDKPMSSMRRGDIEEMKAIDEALRATTVGSAQSISHINDTTGWETELATLDAELLPMLNNPSTLGSSQPLSTDPIHWNTSEEFERIKPMRISFTKKTRPHRSIANDWEMYTDPSSKRPFYRNKHTKISMWDKPTETDAERLIWVNNLKTQGQQDKQQDKLMQERYGMNMDTMMKRHNIDKEFITRMMTREERSRPNGIYREMTIGEKLIAEKKKIIQQNLDERAAEYATEQREKRVIEEREKLRNEYNNAKKEMAKREENRKKRIEDAIRLNPARPTKISWPIGPSGNSLTYDKFNVMGYPEKEYDEPYIPTSYTLPSIGVNGTDDYHPVAYFRD